jgi:ribosomal protein S18 acetylase RimI-like enzyme
MSTNCLTYRVRPLTKEDVPATIDLWNSCYVRGEVVYSPVMPDSFAAQMFEKGGRAFAAEANGRLVGFIHGAQKTVFLCGQTHENTPGYLTVLMVSPECRLQGVGTQLLETLLSAFRKDGKSMCACSGDNPVHLSWRVPGTSGHDHNNAPGVDVDCGGYAFLQKYGFSPLVQEIAMYMNLKDYAGSKEACDFRERLTADGIYTGRFDPSLHQGLDYNGMCDRVGSEYWRNVIRQELAAWGKNEPCRDETLWPDGIKPAGPRPMLIAAHKGNMTGFTGPVDLQKSGRGWFTGICTDPLYGRRGIGTVLFDLLMQEFVLEGAAFTTLFTGAENHAQRIYTRAGLRVVRRFAVMTHPLSDDAAYDQKHF